MSERQQMPRVFCPCFAQTHCGVACYYLADFQQLLQIFVIPSNHEIVYLWRLDQEFDGTIKVDENSIKILH